MPSSLTDAIIEDPDRFLKYLNLHQIASARNPYKEFKRQLRGAFGSTTTGLNMWKHLRNSYKLQNALYKGKDLQKLLPKQFKGAYKKEQYQTLMKTFVKKTSTTIKTMTAPIKKTVNVGKEGVAYTRGNTQVKAHARSKPRKFTDDQIDFLTRRIKQSPKETTQLFNKTFSTNRTYSSIITKVLRLKKG